jgi:2-haloacid dehalogenase
MNESEGPPLVRTLLFDVLGTVVDERGSIESECTTALAAAAGGTGTGQQLAAEWLRRMDGLLGQVTSGNAPWRPNDALRRESLAELTGMSAAGGLTWHCVLSAALIRAYKPDPAVYQMALDLLQLNPDQTLFVAAHPWDLRAAASQGMRTAYISRPGEGTSAATDQFDLYATDLAGLAAAVAGPG